MDELNEESRRCFITTFYDRNRARGKSYTVSHFNKMGVQRKTIFRILQRWENPGTTDRKTGSGGHNKIMKGNKIRSLRTTAINRLGVSTRKLSKKYGVSHVTVFKHLKKLGAVCRK